jgi:hypothetical protein
MRLKNLWFLLPLSLWGAINSNGDVQLWQWTFVRYTIEAPWSLFVTAEVRFGDDVSKFYYTYIQPQIVYAPKQWFFLAPGYRQGLRRHPLTSSKWVLESVPMTDLVFLGQVGEWEIQDRNRVEYVISSAVPFPWLYRNRLRFLMPPFHAGINWRPFFDGEFFWKQANGISEARNSVHFATELFYMARFLKQTQGWTYQNVCNIVLSFKY